MQKAAGRALRGGVLRDQLGGQCVIELGDQHPRRIIISAPLSHRGRNGGTGRRSGLKIRRSQGHESSSLSSGTKTPAKECHLGGILAGQGGVPGVGFLRATGTGGGVMAKAQVRVLPSAKNTGMMVDDQSTGRAILEQVVRSLDERVVVEGFARPVDAVVWATRHVSDLVLVDYMMPDMDGIELVKRLRALPGYEHVPIVMVTVHDDRKVRYAALDAGITDFLTKPVDARECLARCRNLLTLRRQHLVLEDRRRLLEHMVEDATREVRERAKETLLRLARAGEFRDEETGNHLIRMARYSRLITTALTLEEDEAQTIELAAPLHDIGKIGIPDQILLKPAKLDATEWDVMRRHPVIGHEILKGSASKYVRMGALIAFGHHEKYDGSGYPNGLVGDHIPLCARVVAVADVYDALTSVRPYKKAWASGQAFEYVASQAGRHFDPRMVEAFTGMKKEVMQVQTDWRDPAEEPAKP